MKTRLLLPLAGPTVLSVLCVLPMLSGCKDDSPSASGGASASATSSAQGDVLPPVEVTGPKPKYALADLSEKDVEGLVTRAGWTPTVVGKSPPGDDASTVRVAGFRNEGGVKQEAVVFVRCRKDDKPPRVQPGEAFYKDGNCHYQVAVRLGIRNKTAESKRLLETLLGASVE